MTCICIYWLLTLNVNFEKKSIYGMICNQLLERNLLWNNMHAEKKMGNGLIDYLLLFVPSLVLDHCKCPNGIKQDRRCLLMAHEYHLMFHFLPISLEETFRNDSLQKNPKFSLFLRMIYHLFSDRAKEELHYIYIFNSLTFSD